MSKTNESRVVTDGQVVSLEYTLTVDGEVIDSSEGHGPIEFIQGMGNIIPGLEEELYGMKVGESKSVVVPPEDGYGEVDPDAFQDFPREAFPQSIPLEPGVTLRFQDEAGNSHLAVIDSVTDDTVRVDFNHPLAGKELHFEVKVVGLRDATDEELIHGHVHGSGTHD
jgi:FKBP-type peptidyl-prolyl cis-trans isomerase SlyD